MWRWTSDARNKGLARSGGHHDRCSEFGAAKDQDCSPRCRRRQDVRSGCHRSPRPGRNLHRLRRRTSHRHHGPFGLRQVDAAALPRRSRHPHVRCGVHRRHRLDQAQRQAAHLAASGPGRLCLPGLQPCADAHCGGEHHAPVGPRRAAARPVMAAHPRHESRRRRPVATPAVGAVGWPAATRRLRQGDGHPPRADLRRRADRQPRFAIGHRAPRSRLAPRSKALGRRSSSSPTIPVPPATPTASCSSPTDASSTTSRTPR